MKKKLVMVLVMVSFVMGTKAQPEFEDGIEDTPINGLEVILGIGGLFLGIIRNQKPEGKED